MLRKEAQSTARPDRAWKSPLSIAIGALVVFAVCIAARNFTGPGAATAQAPRPSTPAAGRSTPPRTAGPAAETLPAPRSQQPARGAGSNPPATGSAGHLGDNDKTQLRVMAVVNGQQITGEHLANECLRRYGKDVLETMVNKHLIMQECQARGITITHQDVEDEISHMAAKFGLPKDRWLQLLETEREISPDKYRREIIWPTLALRRLAASRIDVTQEELRKAFESQYGPSVKARIISVSSREKAQQLYEQLLAEPAKFGEIAKTHSEDTNSAAARGLIPPIRKHLGHAEVEQVAFSLKVGEISPVIQVANQYLILKCEQHIPETYISSTSLKQIENQLHDQIRDEKLRTAAAELFQELQDDARVVNVFNDTTLKQRTPGVAATVNDRNIAMDLLARECLLRHGEEVLDGEINRFVLQQELTRRGKSVTQPMIDEEVARAADAYGYLRPDGSPDVDAWLETVTRDSNVSVDLYIRDAVWPSVALKAMVGDQIQVTDEDLQKGFESNYGERVEVLAIVVGNQRVANDVWEAARKRPTDQAFGELAHEHSIEPVSRANFGRVPPVRNHGGQPLIEEEAFRLKPGELSGIIAVGDKYVILRCLGRTRPVVEQFSDVEKELRKDLHEKKLRLAMAEQFDRLKESAQIDNFLAGTSQTGRRAAGPASPAAEIRR